MTNTNNYDRYVKVNKIMSGLHSKKKNEAFEEVTQEPEATPLVEPEKITSKEAFDQLKDLLKERLSEDNVDVYIEPLVERPEVIVIVYKGHSFEIARK